jgi:hypothetical protein
MVSYDITTRCNEPADHNMNVHRRENLKPQNSSSWRVSGIFSTSKEKERFNSWTSCPTFSKSLHRLQNSFKKVSALIGCTRTLVCSLYSRDICKFIFHNLFWKPVPLCMYIIRVQGVFHEESHLSCLNTSISTCQPGMPAWFPNFRLSIIFQIQKH